MYFSHGTADADTLYEVIYNPFSGMVRVITKCANTKSSQVTISTTNNSFFLDLLSCGETSYIGEQKPATTVKKNWRWWHVFRQRSTPTLPPKLEVYGQIVRRVQERYAEKQRARQKRKSYVQSLYARCAGS